MLSISLKHEITQIIPDLTGAEHGLVSGILFSRYGKLVPIQLAASELKLDEVSDELTLCPTIYWTERGAQFVVCRVAASGSGYVANSFILRPSHTVPAMNNMTALETAR